MSKRQESILLIRMIWIEKSNRKRITKHGGGFAKSNTMFGQITGSLVRIPLKLH
jgi:hypothetical protein